MSEEDGLIMSFRLDGRGGAEAVGWEEIESWKPGDDGILWVHLDRSKDRAQRYLYEQSGLEEIVSEALLAEETRPRSMRVHGGLLVILRGINLNEGAEAEEMIALRMWGQRGRVITVRHRRIRSIEEVRDTLLGGSGPTTEGEMLTEIGLRLAEKMSPVIGELDDQIDALENDILESQPSDVRAALGIIRRKAISLRRHIAPQRDVMTTLQNERADFLSDGDRMRAREIGDRITRYVEELDTIRERAAVIQEELGNRLAESMNRTMLTLSVVASVFLPLGLITGLLGINVGGLPGVDNDWAFYTVSGLLALIAVIQLWLLRRLQIF